jgi:hypothetical protein
MLWIFNKGVVLRGDGPQSTRILNEDSSNDPVIRVNRWPMYGSLISVNSGYEKGSNVIVVADASSLAVGDYLIVSQLNDPSFVTIVGNNGSCSWCGDGSGERTMAQIVRVTGKSGQELTLNRPLYYTFSAAYSPAVKKINMMQYGGIEDLYLEQIGAVPGEDESSNIHIGACAHCWVSNVESHMTSNIHVDLMGCYGCEIRDSYLDDAYNHYGGDGYGVFLFGRNSDNLVENNIIVNTRHAMSLESGGSGNVFGYNFADEGLDSNSPMWITHDAMTHGAHPYMNLWEGNVHDKIGLDNIWGSSSHNTLFRNHVDRLTSRAAYGLWAVDIEENNYYENLVGNVLCHDGCSGTYEYGEGGSKVSVYKLGYQSPGDGSLPVDAQVVATLLRHGNYDYVTQTTVWDATITNHDLPASLYLSGKPVWFGTTPWPAIGPDVDGLVNKIPAQFRWEALQGYPIFTDAFESGGMSRWSATTP